MATPQKSPKYKAITPTAEITVDLVRTRTVDRAREIRGRVICAGRVINAVAAICVDCGCELAQAIPMASGGATRDPSRDARGGTTSLGAGRRLWAEASSEAVAGPELLAELQTFGG
jgi:hypothetical protein